jgi:hypothetical protein
VIHVNPTSSQFVVTTDRDQDQYILKYAINIKRRLLPIEVEIDAIEEIKLIEGL